MLLFRFLHTTYPIQDIFKYSIQHFCAINVNYKIDTMQEISFFCCPKFHFFFLRTRKNFEQTSLVSSIIVMEGTNSSEFLRTSPISHSCESDIIDFLPGTDFQRLSPSHQDVREVRAHCPARRALYRAMSVAAWASPNQPIIFFFPLTAEDTEIQRGVIIFEYK